MGPNWLEMTIYDHGRFWIVREAEGCGVRYQLRSLHGLIFCPFAGLIFFTFVGITDGLRNGIKYGLAAFVWLYGMNLAIAVARVPRTIRKALS